MPLIFHLIVPLKVKVSRLSCDYPQGRCFLLVDHMQYHVSVLRYSYDSNTESHKSTKII